MGKGPNAKRWEYTIHVINSADLQKVDFELLREQKFNKACQTLLFGFIPIDTAASVAKAAWQADIKHVSYVETSYTYLFPIVIQNCVMVFGE